MAHRIAQELQLQHCAEYVAIAIASLTICLVTGIVINLCMFEHSIQLSTYMHMYVHSHVHTMLVELCI